MGNPQHEHADRVAFLVDAAEYFERFADAVDRARESILILGWDVHSRTPLRRAAGEDGELGRLLDRAAARRPRLWIRLLIWDCSVFCAVQRETFQTLRLGWTSHPRVRIEFDDRHRVGACHHQKLVVVDDEVAFVGGIDLTDRRRDTPAHAPDDPERVSPDGSTYRPYHDVQAVLSGPAAAALAELARERWTRATGETPAPASCGGDPWPAGLKPDVENAAVGIYRTDTCIEGAEEIREIERLYVDAIGAARHCVYLENQYLTSSAACEALAATLRREAGPEVCIVVPWSVSGWLEDALMGALRARAIRRLREADLHDRLRVWYPDCGAAEEDRPIVHTKLAVFDDSLLTIGSANLSNRSFGLDTECNIVIDAEGDAEVAAALTGLRDRLVAEHLGCEPDAVAAAVRREGSLRAAADSLRGGTRTLEPLRGEESPGADALIGAKSVLDPERPWDWERLVGTLAGW